MIVIKRYAAPPIRMDEILRYAAAKGGGEAVSALARECLSEAENNLSYSVCYREFPITHSETGLDLSFCKIESATLGKALGGCDRVIVFAATVGLEMDRLIARYSRLSPAKALMLQAIGSERIEALCDTFCRDLNAEYKRMLRPRVSPGYGDIPLSMQKEIFAVLDCSRKIGLLLNASLLMTPTKSVTAIVGIGDQHEHP